MQVHFYYSDRDLMYMYLYIITTILHSFNPKKNKDNRTGHTDLSITEN